MGLRRDFRLPLSTVRIKPQSSSSLGARSDSVWLRPQGRPRNSARGNLAHRGNSSDLGTSVRTYRELFNMRLALYQPDIAQNTGTILRLCACLGVAVDVIGPTGFDMSDRALKRAALDYLDHVDLTRHASFSEFMDRRASQEAPSSGGRLVLLTAHAETPHFGFAFEPNDTLMLGRESAGCPELVHAQADARITIPMRPGLRSLNVAVTAAIALGEALRQTDGFPSPRLGF